jgi:hypothetical protein
MQTNQDPNQKASDQKNESAAKANALNEQKPTINGADPAEEWIGSQNPAARIHRSTFKTKIDTAMI